MAKNLLIDPVWLREMQARLAAKLKPPNVANELRQITQNYHDTWATTVADKLISKCKEEALRGNTHKSFVNEEKLLIDPRWKDVREVLESRGLVVTEYPDLKYRDLFKISWKEK